jgi:hypothetical protein
MTEHSKKITTFFKSFAFTLTVLSLFTHCSEDELVDSVTENTPDIEIHATSTTLCGCTYTVPATASTVDGKAMNFKPGAVICLSATVKYKNLQFKNLLGSASQPIIIKNCGGTVTLNATGLSFGLKFVNSKYFRVTGGNTPNVYGIKINNGHIGMSLEYLSTNFEVDHVETAYAGFAGIMAKTDPGCDNATIRENFTMYNVSFHDNYVHHCAGEGLYIGNSFYEGAKTSCGTRLPHEIHNAKIYNNVIKYSGWEGIQLGCATKGAAVYNNTIENFGTKNITSQNNGVQLGVGTGGVFYNNFIKNGPGNGLIVLGLGDNVIHNNVIVNVGTNGIFCDDRYSPGTGFKFLNNTIVNPQGDGIRLYADRTNLYNIIYNTIVVNPGSYTTYSYPRTSADAYVYKLSSKVKVQTSNNYFTRSITALKFINSGANNYRLYSSSPAVNKGRSISTYNIPTDFYKQARLKGSAYDIGASEY